MAHTSNGLQYHNDTGTKQLSFSLPITSIDIRYVYRVCILSCQDFFCVH